MVRARLRQKVRVAALVLLAQTGKKQAVKKGRRKRQLEKNLRKHKIAEVRASSPPSCPPVAAPRLGGGGGGGGGVGGIVDQVEPNRFAGLACFANLRSCLQFDDEIDEGFPPWFLYVAYTACIGWCVFCGLYALAVAIYFGPDVNIGFMLSTLTATGFEGIVQDPLKIWIMVLIADQSEVCVDLYYELMDIMPFQL
jgi:hypothetical protein